GQPWDEIYSRARQEIYRAVQAHEVGHTLGLRHNFEGSYDAMNFHDEFWENYNPATEQVERVDGSGNATDVERYMYSSIMDYMPRPFDDWGGIGKYDEAAIAFGYGQLVEIWEPEAAAFYLDDLMFLNDYTRIPRFLGGDMSCITGNGDCHPDMLTALTTNSNTEISQAVNSYLFDAKNYGSLPANSSEVVTRLNQRRFVRFDEIFQAYRDFYTGNGSDIFFNLKEVDYRFCPDERVFPNNEECQRWDKGANYREIIRIAGSATTSTIGSITLSVTERDSTTTASSTRTSIGSSTGIWDRCRACTRTTSSEISCRSGRPWTVSS
ncbi:MAG: zinc-dependent metalloprotease, partial [Myxococcota bacterium]